MSYYQNKESVDEYIRLAAGFNGQEIIDRLENYLASGATILELGTGPGGDWKILSEKYEVVGSDFSEEFLIRLKKANPEGLFIILDAITLDAVMTNDGIYSNKVLHHLTDEQLRNSFVKQLDLLNENGLICHSFWKGDGIENFKGLYVNYQTEAVIEEMLSPYYHIEEIQSYNEFEDNDSFFIIARKK